MNAGRHLTIDQIADHEAGLSSADDAREMVAHLAGCEACREAASALVEVKGLLGAAGRAAEPMPAEVADAIDAALATASAERSAGVPSLEARRASQLAAETSAEETSQPAPAGRRGRWMLGAAAAVAVLAIGGAVASNGLPGQTSNQDNSAGASKAEREPSAVAGAAAGTTGSPSRDQPAVPGPTDFGTKHGELSGRSTPRLDAGSVSAYAAQLFNGRVHPVKRVPPSCGVPTVTGQDSIPVRGLRAAVNYNGQPALLDVNGARRTLTVYACPGPTRVLYRSTY